ncbi:MAG: zf-HC2 domain-containing protein [Gemmatimonadetes bacterium]|nr:zf-HC2 domain-containing protein [Gemmatimonadota bacterium]
MMEHPIESRLHDYVDDALSPAERGAIEDHLAECASCREQVERLRALVGALAALPREVLPTHDLRPGIAARIAPRRPGRLAELLAPKSASTFWGPFADRTLWSARVPLAAAAVVLVVLSSVLTLLLVTPIRKKAAQVQAPAAQTAEAPAAVLAEFRGAEAGYLRAIGELESALGTRGSQLAPETIAILERNLRIIDAALAESRAALAQAPANPELARIILSTYEQKLELLRQAQRTIG